MSAGVQAICNEVDSSTWVSPLLCRGDSLLIFVCNPTNDHNSLDWDVMFVRGGHGWPACVRGLWQDDSCGLVHITPTHLHTYIINTVQCLLLYHPLLNESHDSEKPKTILHYDTVSMRTKYV